MSKLDEFFDNSMILDTETTGVDDDSDIIEFSASFPVSASDEFSQILNYTERYKPTHPVPAEASAVHFITTEDLQDCSTYKNSMDVITSLMETKQYFIGHNVQFDRSMLVANHKRNNPVVPPEMLDETRWICTLRFAKKLFAEDPEFKNLTLSYLWFKFELYKNCNHTIKPHSAEDDVFMCYKVLEHLVNIAAQRGHIDLTLDVGEEIVKYCNTPIRYEVMPFGKHKGMLMTELPLDYMKWMITNSDILNEEMPNFEPDLAFTFLSEYESRVK